MRRKVMVVVLLAGLAAMAAGAVMIWPAVWVIVSGEGLPDTTPPQVLPPTWATPIDLPGVENLHRIDEGLYRGAQPTAKGFRRLAEMGVKTVVNLRSIHDDEDETAGTGLDCIDIHTEPWDLDQRQVAEFLQIVIDPSRRPVFFHCQHGADRTGAMAAAYRMVVEGWTAQQAIDEMTRGGYGFHRAWAGVVDFVRGLDVDGLRRQLHLPTPPAKPPASSQP